VVVAYSKHWSILFSNNLVEFRLVLLNRLCGCEYCDNLASSVEFCRDHLRNSDVVSYFFYVTTMDLDLN